MVLALSPAARRSIGICAFYACTSVTLSFVNKFVLSRYQFKCTFTLLATQLAALLIICGIVKRLPEDKQPFPLPDLQWSTYKQSIGMSCAFVFNVSAGFVALRLVNIPLFLCIRRTTTCFVMVAEFFVLGKVAGRETVYATMLIGAGAVLAGYSTLSANLVGFTFVALNNILTALSLTLTTRFSNATGLTAFGLLFYNALTALPLCLLFAAIAGEGQTLSEFEHLFEPGFVFGVVLSACLGMVLSYALVLCSTINSPMATSVTGNLKDIVSTVLGAVLFGDFHPDSTTLAGLATSLTGAMWFSRIKLLAAQSNAKGHDGTPAHGDSLDSEDDDEFNSSPARTFMPMRPRTGSAPEGGVLPVDVVGHARHRAFSRDSGRSDSPSAMI